MTPAEFQALMAERYQPRHLTKPGDPLPAVQTMDELLASLRAEAKKPVPGERRDYAKPSDEARRLQNEDADRFIQYRVERQKVQDEIRRHDAKRKPTRPRVSRATKVQIALAQGQSLHEALQVLGKG